MYKYEIEHDSSKLRHQMSWNRKAHYIGDVVPMTKQNKVIANLANGTETRFRLRFKNIGAGWGPWSEYSDYVDTSSNYRAFVSTNRYVGKDSGTLPDVVNEDGDRLEQTLLASGYCNYRKENVIRVQDANFRNFNRGLSKFVSGCNSRSVVTIYISGFCITAQGMAKVKSKTRNKLSRIKEKAEINETRFVFKDTNFESKETFASTTYSVSSLAKMLAKIKCKQCVLVLDWSHRAGLAFSLTIGNLAYVIFCVVFVSSLSLFLSHTDIYTLEYFTTTIQ